MNFLPRIVRDLIDQHGEAEVRTAMRKAREGERTELTVRTDGVKRVVVFDPQGVPEADCPR